MRTRLLIHAPFLTFCILMASELQAQQEKTLVIRDVEGTFSNMEMYVVMGRLNPGNQSIGSAPPAPPTFSIELKEDPKTPLRFDPSRTYQQRYTLMLEQLEASKLPVLVDRADGQYFEKNNANGTRVTMKCKMNGSSCDIVEMTITQ